jgi:hypothetical protein
MRCVPVLRVGQSSLAVAEIVRAVAEADGRGAALRYPARRLVPPPRQTLAAILTQALDSLELAPGSADLLIDLEWIDPGEPLQASNILQIVEDLADAAPWRTVIVLGTTMPTMLSLIPEMTIGSLPRHEWDLWRMLRSMSESVALCYGDYAVQNPQPPAEKTGPGMRANVRYTSEMVTIIARGKSVLQEGKEQYSELCRWLTVRPEYAGASFSWGDEVIQRCADGDLAPGAQDLWRGAGTSHHLRFVTEQLRTLAGS